MLWLRLPVGNIYVYGDVEPRFGPHALLESLSSEYEGLVDDCDEKTVSKAKGAEAYMRTPSAVVQSRCRPGRMHLISSEGIFSKGACSLVRYDKGKDWGKSTVLRIGEGRIRLQSDQYYDIHNL